MMRALRLFGRIGLSGAVVATVLALPRFAEAAPPWVDRDSTLPRRDWAFDVGFGLGHERPATGPGFNFEGAAGVTERIQVGLRTGARIGNEAERARADWYGRPFDTETYGTGMDALANPELYVRGAVIRGGVTDLALEGRIYLPFERGTHFGMMFGLPVMFHLGGVARIDTGIYVPVVLQDPVQTHVSFPLHLWFQVGRELWLGPILGVRIDNPGANVHLPVGFGLGYSITSYLDLKTWLLFPQIEGAGGAGDRWGVGVGLQIRIE
jgi:hypothetical protein